jgi:hypothetical protein
MAAQAGTAFGLCFSFTNIVIGTNFSPSGKGFRPAFDLFFAIVFNFDAR